MFPHQQIAGRIYRRNSMNIATYIKRDLNVRAEAVETPVFDNSDMWFSTWKHRNRVVLEDYFNQLGVTAEEEYICTMIQYERQQAAQAESANTQRQAAQEELYHIGYTMRDDESSFSMFHDGIPMIGEI
jgi:hypothetical protein